jgi:TRAP-type mannitol/chloroaromatic compound transport system permease small subunit
MTIGVALIVSLRFGFGLNSTAAQESISYMHACLFMLCLSFAAQTGAHVRVDIFYRRFSDVQKAWVNLLGHLLFLLPFALFVCGISWHWALQSWAVQESSNNPGGLPFVFLLKTLLPVSGSLLALQALSDGCKQVLTLSFQEAEDVA